MLIWMSSCFDSRRHADAVTTFTSGTHGARGKSGGAEEERPSRMDRKNKEFKWNATEVIAWAGDSGLPAAAWLPSGRALPTLAKGGILSRRSALIPPPHVAPPTIEGRATAVPDAEQRPHAFALGRVLGQAATVVAGRLVPIQVRAAFLITVEDVRLHARVRQAAPAAPDAGQGTQVRGRRAAWPVFGPGDAPRGMGIMASGSCGGPVTEAGPVLGEAGREMQGVAGKRSKNADSPKLLA